MSSINHVLAAAKAIALKGQTPNLALIKSKVGSHVPMPILIQGLRQFKAMSKESWVDITEVEEPTHTPTQQPTISELQNKIFHMQQQIDMLTERLTIVEQNQSKDNQ